MTQAFDHSAFRSLQNKVNQTPQMDYSLRSRVHALNEFCFNPHVACFVKRDDELGFGISGNKLRKYRTLLPYLIKKECKKAILLGGPFSNNILSLSQLLLENKIIPTLFLRGNKPTCHKGNFLLLQMLLPSTSMHWIPRTEWCNIHSHVSKYIDHRPNFVVIPEGASFFPAFPGALTLPLDIIQNEQELNLSFDHIFIDVGTGFSAAALLLGFAFMCKQTCCHLLLLADEEKDFLNNLQQWHQYFEEWIGESCPFPTKYRCWRSSLAPSFGSTSRAVIKFLMEIARGQGLFLDPIYSGKLFHQAKKQLEEDLNIQGNILIIHSGGALTLIGFQEQILKELNSYAGSKNRKS